MTRINVCNANEMEKHTDIVEHPGLHAKLYRTRNDRCNDLAPEHCSRWNLHIVAQFEVTRKLQCLAHCLAGHRTSSDSKVDVIVGAHHKAPSLEHHHRNRPSGQRVANH